MNAGAGCARGLFFCALILHCVARSGAQDATPEGRLAAKAEGATATVQKQPEGLIHLDVAVRDGQGRPVEGLTEKDFTLLDNGVPQQLLSFRGPGPEVAGQDGDANAQLVEAAIMLDQVNLTTGQFTAVKKATIDFLRQNGGHLPLPVSIYLFTIGGLQATAKASTDGNALAEQIAHGRLPRIAWDVLGNGLVLGDGEFLGNGHTMGDPVDRWDSALKSVYAIALERMDVPGRKALVWLGYGWVSRLMRQPARIAFDSFADLSSRLREARVAVCQVPIWPNPSEFNFDYNKFRTGPRSPADLQFPNDPTHYFALPVMALQSGGTIKTASSQIVGDIGACLRDTNSIYGISFNPPPAVSPNEYHELKVETRVPGATARTNTGYYDQPVFYDQPRIPTRRLSVHELEALLAADSGEHDGALSDQLAGLELTERLSSQRLEQWKSRLHGNKSREELTVLADASIFLSPPAEDVLPDPAPSHDELVAMLSKTVKYLDQTMAHLPDFSATRVVAAYKQRSPASTDTWKTALADQTLHLDATERGRVLYRNGHEVHEEVKKKGGRAARGKDLDFIGVFGPILHSVLSDATRNNGKLTWARWERGPQGREAVVSYEVAVGNSSYDVVHCCLRGSAYFKSLPAYHGEIAVDPDSGAILRLTMDAAPGWIVEPNLHPVRPVEMTGTMIEYGPVAIGARRAVVPLRSVVVTRARSVREWTLWEEPVEVYSSYQTQLNDIAYVDYRRFGSEAQIFFGAPDQTSAPAAGDGKGAASPQKAPKF